MSKNEQGPQDNSPTEPEIFLHEMFGHSDAAGALLSDREKQVLDDYFNLVGKELESLTEYYPTGVPDDIRDAVIEEGFGKVEGAGAIVDKVIRFHDTFTDQDQH